MLSRAISLLWHNRYIRAWLVPLALLPLLSGIFLSNLGDLSNYHGDETLWLPVSNKLFRLYTVERNVSDPDWYEEWNSFGARHPQIGKYLIGFGTYLAGYRGEPYKPYYWHWKKDFAWNMEHDGVPPAQFVYAGRVPIAITSIIACLMLYWLASLVVGSLAGLLSVAVLVQSNMLVYIGRNAWIDPPGLAFGLMTLVGLVYMLRALHRNAHRQALLFSLATGLALGLALGSKLNTLLILAVCGIMFLIELVVSLRSRSRLTLTVLLCAIIGGACAWLIFFGSNPFLYGNVLAGCRYLIEMGTVVVTSVYNTPAERAHALWDSMLLYAPLARFGLPYDRWLILAGAVMLGSVVIWRRTYARARQLDMIAIYIIVSYVGILLWLPQPWERYFLPLQPCNALLETIAVIWPLQGLWYLINRTRSSAESSLHPADATVRQPVSYLAVRPQVVDEVMSQSIEDRSTAEVLVLDR